MEYGCFHFKVVGEPVAKGRPRFSRMGGFMRTYTPKRTLEAERIIREACMEQCGTECFPLKGPLSVTIKFFMPVAASLSKKKKAALRLSPHTKRPDVDNLAKTVCDALNRYAWEDDSQIYMLTSIKAYCPYDDPCTCVEICSVGEKNDYTERGNN